MMDVRVDDIFQCIKLNEITKKTNNLMIIYIFPWNEWVYDIAPVLFESDQDRMIR